MSKEMPAWKETAREKFLDLYWKYKKENKGKTDEKIAEEIGIPLSTMLPLLFAAPTTLPILIFFFLMLRTIPLVLPFSFPRIAVLWMTKRFSVHSMATAATPSQTIALRNLY